MPTFEYLVVGGGQLGSDYERAIRLSEYQFRVASELIRNYGGDLSDRFIDRVSTEHCARALRKGLSSKPAASTMPTTGKLGEVAKCIHTIKPIGDAAALSDTDRTAIADLLSLLTSEAENRGVNVTRCLSRT